jgi:hypothetical protein
VYTNGSGTSKLDTYGYLVLIAVNTNEAVFWVVTLSNFEKDQRFGRTYRLYIQCRIKKASKKLNISVRLFLFVYIISIFALFVPRHALAYAIHVSWLSAAVAFDMNLLNSVKTIFPECIVH